MCIRDSTNAEQRQLRVLIGQIYADYIEQLHTPVSYTHLDVYKRQVQVRILVVQQFSIRNETKAR